MSQPIWPVVTENLAEQLAAAQGGIVHVAQLLPYLPLSLELIEQALDQLTASARVEKHHQGELVAYIFHDSVNNPSHTFKPKRCVYSDEELDEKAFTAIAPELRQKIEAELANLAEYDAWPADAMRQHELVYLTANLPSPVTTRAIASHSPLPLKRVKLHLSQLQRRGAVHSDAARNTWELPPLEYPHSAYARHSSFLHQFPAALKEEQELRWVKALSSALVILLLSLMLAVVARIPFPLVFFGGLLIAFFIFLKTLKAPPHRISEI